MVEIYVIGRSHFDANAFLRFLERRDEKWRRSDNVSSADELVEAAGRVCYMSFGPRQSPRDNADYIAHLIEMGHESVLEHVSWTFLLAGVSRAFTHQLVRHRVGVAFSQLSQQYHDESGATFVRPSLIDSSPHALSAWNRALTAARRAYEDISRALETSGQADTLVSDKRERQRAIRSAARSILPNATETVIVMTANARALRYFLTVRGGIVGDEEMRQVSAELVRRLQAETLILFGVFKIDELPDGSPIVRSAALLK